MKRRKTLSVILVLSVIGLLIGWKLQKIYGFDRPYIYFYSGFFLELFSCLMAAISLMLFLFDFGKNKT